jgi:sortase B
MKKLNDLKRLMAKHYKNILTGFLGGIMLASLINIGMYTHNLIRQRGIEREISEIWHSLPTHEELLAMLPGLSNPVSHEDLDEAETISPANEETREDFDGQELLAFQEEIGRLRFEPLLEINPDFLGMIFIPGLGIEYPFVQYVDNNKYLRTNFHGSRSDHGTIFMDYKNDPLLLDYNTVLYGHHMNDRSMFTELVRYRNLNAYAEAPVIVIDSLTGMSIWLVFAAYVCEPDYGYIDTTVYGERFEALLDEIQRRSLFHTNVDVTAEDRIITLSTCVYDFHDARFAVHARLQRDGEDMPVFEAARNTNQKRPEGVIYATPAPRPTPTPKGKP